MKLLLFGGTFDPPHIGHRGLLENAIRTAAPDKVFVVPDEVPPHKDPSSAPAHLRLAMCECFRPLFPSMVISDMEIQRGGRSYTIDTVQTLGRQYSGAQLYLAIGGDMLLHFTAWHRYQDLLRQVVLVVQNRGEDGLLLQQAAAGLRKQGGRILFTREKVPAVSSTEIRAGLAKGEDLYFLLPPPADEIVRRHNLYKEDTHC